MGALKFGLPSPQGARTYVPLDTPVPMDATIVVRASTAGGRPAPARIIRPWGGRGPVLAVPTLLATIHVRVDVLDDHGRSLARGRVTVRPEGSLLDGARRSRRAADDDPRYGDLDRRPCGRSSFTAVDFVYSDGIAWDTVHGTAEFWGPDRDSLGEGTPFELRVIDLHVRTVDAPPAVVLRDDLVSLEDGSWIRRVAYSQNVSRVPGPLILWARSGRDGIGDAFTVLEDCDLAFWRGLWQGRREARPDGDGYRDWFERRSRTSGLDLEVQRAQPLTEGSKVSLVVDLSESSPEDLGRTLDSLAAQTHGSWELVGFGGDGEGDPWRWRGPDWADGDLVGGDADDTLAERPTNAREAIARAEGMAVGTVAAGSVLEPDCLYRLCERLAKPGVVMAYGDDDVLGADGEGRGVFRDAVVKPPFDRTLLYATGYTRHPSLVKRGCLEGRPLPAAIDDLRVLDFELALRAVERVLEVRNGNSGEIAPGRSETPWAALSRAIEHVPLVLCHEPGDGGPGARIGSPVGSRRAEGCRRALAAHLERLRIAGEVVENLEAGRGLRIDPPADTDGGPLISIVIPNKDAPEVLETCVLSVLGLSAHRNLEVVIVENNSELKATFDTYERLLRDPRVRLVRHEGAFNFSAVCNHGAAEAHGDYLVFLNNDTEVIEPLWLDLLRGPIDRGEAGVVGARLLYRDLLLQHAGVALEPNGPNHLEHHVPPDYESYLGLSQFHAHQASAVTGACLMMGRALFEELGGFDENFPVAFNDTDLCLRARALGQGVAVDPRALLWHYESYSRGGDFADSAKLAALLEAGGRLAERWTADYALGDPCYDHRFGYDDVYFGLAGEASHYDRED